MQVVVFDIDSIKQYLTIIWVIETHQHIDNGTLSASRLANESDHLVWLNCHGQSFENETLLSSWVSEPNISELNQANC